MNKYLLLVLVALICMPAAANDAEKRQKAAAHFLEGRNLLAPRFDRSLHIQDTDRIEAARAQFRLAMVELLAIAPANRNPEDMRAIYEAASYIAARGTVKPPCCLLCLLNGKLIGSHVIPNSVLVRLTNEVLPDGEIGKNVGSIGCASSPNKNSAAASATSPIFCKIAGKQTGCEDIFRLYGEDHFAAPFWLFIAATKQARSQQPMVASRFQGILGGNFVHFCVASIVFRYMLVNGRNDITPFVEKYGSAVQEGYWRLFFLLRDYMLNPSNGPFPHVELFVSEAHVGQKSMISAVCTTYPKGNQPCFASGHFEWAGFHFIVMESADARVHCAADYALPPNAFCQVVNRQGAAQALVIEILPEHVLVLPYAATRARRFDGMVWQQLVFSRSPKREIVNGVDGSMMPVHPLADEIMQQHRFGHWSRLPDDMRVVEDHHDGSYNLRFTEPSKMDVLTHTEFCTDLHTCHVWLCKHKLSKKDPFMAVIFMLTARSSIAFGYHLADRLFDADLRAKAEAALDACREGNNQAAEHFLETKPLRSTGHDLIEDVSQTPWTYYVIIDTLMGWWAHHFDAPPPRPRRFVAHSGANEVHFVERPLPKDNDCGFHMLGISRQDAIALLIKNTDNKAIRRMVGNDIFAAFIANELPEKLRVESILRSRLHYEGLVSRIHKLEAQLKRMLPEGLHSLIGRFEAQFRDFFSMFNEAALERGANAQESLEELAKLYGERRDCLKRVRDWAEGKGVYHWFIKEFLETQRQWLTYLPGQRGLLDALAQLLNLDIDIWVPRTDNPTILLHLHATNDHIVPGARHIDAIHTDDLTHFNLLEEVTVEAEAQGEFEQEGRAAFAATTSSSGF